MTQATLDDLLGLTAKDAQPAKAADPTDLSSLDQYAFLYTATEKGNTTGIKMIMTVDDARKWCSSPLSRGQLHGTQWAYFWTTIANYVGYHWGVIYHDVAHALSVRAREDRVIDLTEMEDNGLWNEKIASTGARKLSLADLAPVFDGLGITIKTSK